MKENDRYVSKLESFKNIKGMYVVEESPDSVVFAIGDVSRMLNVRKASQIEKMLTDPIGCYLVLSQALIHFTLMLKNINMRHTQNLSQNLKTYSKIMELIPKKLHLILKA